MSAFMQMDGLDDVMAKLARYEKDFQKKVLVPVMTKDTKPVLAKVRDYMPAMGETDDATGTLRRSIGRKVKGYKSGVVVVVIGAQQGFAVTTTTPRGREVKRDPIHYLHLYERGTKHSAAKKPMQRAWDSEKSACESRVRKGILEGIEKL